jgi:formylglycine-generating enzyme required for sulfatase activity
MPDSQTVSKQRALGGAAGILLLLFALTYRYFPEALHLRSAPHAPNASRADAGRNPPWSASLSRAPSTPGSPDGAAKHDATTLEEAMAMGPPLPTTREITALLRRARVAEERGDSGDAPEQAIALYREALGLDPSNPSAQAGLARIGGAARDWAIAAVQRNDEQAAQRNLALFESLPHSDKELDALRGQIAVLGKVMPLLAKAADQLKAGHAVEPAGDNALATYRRIREIDPDNALADEGLATIERGLLDDALGEAARDDFAAADVILAKASDIRPGSQALLETRARIEGLRRQRAASVLAQAQSALDAGNADLAEQLAQRAQLTSPDLPGLDAFAQRLSNARLYASLKPGEVVRDRFLDISGQAPSVVVIPTGSFIMGSPAGEEGRRDSEEPQRAVHIATGFALGRSEVSVAEFGLFVANSRYVTDAERQGSATIYEESSGRMREQRGVTWRDDYHGERAQPDLPVAHVSWNDAIAYLDWLSQRTGKRYRLPSEAEFEYALRAGSATRYPWGDGAPASVLENMTGDGDRSPSMRSWTRAFPGYKDGYWGPAPVAHFRANAFGLFDMNGNLSEWVADCWHDNYVRAPRDSRAWNNPGCTTHVIRGGSWGSAPDQVRSAYRIAAAADARSARVGFRVARDL